MLRRILMMLFFGSLSSLMAMGQYTTCADLSTQIGPYFWDPFGTTQHTSWGHYFYNTLVGTCTYSTSSVPLSQYCANQSYSYGSISNQELGHVVLPFHHNNGNSVASGVSASPSGAAATMTQATAAAATTSCITFCGAVVGISAGASGVGATVTFPPDSILTGATSITTPCPIQNNPQNGGGCSVSGAPCEGGGGGEECNSNSECDSGCCYDGYCSLNSEDCPPTAPKSGDPQVSSQIKKMAKQRKGDTNTNLN
jgi:hypothetical protein